MRESGRKEKQSVGREYYFRVLLERVQRKVVGIEGWTVKAVFKMGQIIAYFYAKRNDPLAVRK